MLDKVKSFFNKNDKGETSSVNFAIGQHASLAAQNEVAATDVMSEGMELFLDAAKRYENKKVSIRQGDLFEYIEAAKFNADSAAKGSDLKAYITDAQGQPHAPADIRIQKGDEIIKEVQAKSSNSSDNAFKEIFKKRDKYKGMDKLTNKEHINDIKRKTTKGASRNNIYADDHREINKNIKGKLEQDNVNSGGTSYNEARKAAENPNKYAYNQEMKVFANEVKKKGLQGAAAGAVIGGGISIIKNTYAVSQGEKNLNEALIDTAKDSGKSGIRGGVTGTAGALTRHYGGKKFGVIMLKKSNIATSVAAGTIDAGVTVLKFAKGEITSEEAVERIGKTGTSTMSGIYVGAAAGSVFGPPGAAIGSIAGYIVCSGVYESCISIFKNAKLTEEEAEKVVLLYEEARKEMKKQREEFENMIDQQLKMNNKQFENLFSQIENGLDNNNFEKVISGISNIAVIFGEELRFKSFEEFDNFMSNSEGTIKL